jgi:hypothetical protein
MNQELIDNVFKLKGLCTKRVPKNFTGSPSRILKLENKNKLKIGGTKQKIIKLLKQKNK